MESLWGGLEMGAAMVTPFLGSRRRRWGVTDDELDRTYPGDELIPDPKWTADHAISIEATPEQVWPWIAQIGQGRGGFYSYQKLENLAGCQIENASRILEQPDGTTRLLSRTRYDHGDDFRSRLMGGALLIEPVSFVMERKMLKVIKALVESSRR